MSPGTTNRPDASMTSCTRSGVRLAPTESILSSSIRMSATAGLWTSPSWSYTWPPRISVLFDVIYARSSASGETSPGSGLFWTGALHNAMRSSRLLRWLNRTPVQTFILCPLLVVAFELVRQRAQLTIVPAGFALLAWGYLQYLLVGRFRNRLGGGGPGLGVPPDRIVEDGPYRYVRNPMYLGHLVFMLGLALTFASWFALILFAARALWFHRRVLEDETRLQEMFGASYLDYQRRVKRWIPGLL